MLFLALLLMIFWAIWCKKVLRRVYFGLTPKPEDPLKLAILPFLVEVCYEFVAGVWEAGLSVAGDLVGYIGLVRVMRLMCIVAQYFVNSSLYPVLLIRRRLKSVADVLKGTRSKGFTQSRRDALLRYWGAVRRHGLCGLISSLHPWDNWIPPDLHGFYKWVF